MQARDFSSCSWCSLRRLEIYSPAPGSVQGTRGVRSRAVRGLAAGAVTGRVEILGHTVGAVGERAQVRVRVAGVLVKLQRKSKEGTANKQEKVRGAIKRQSKREENRWN